MKHRIFTNWTITRVLFLMMGIATIIQSIMSRQWVGIAFGSYFASMGLFAFGCAGGNCYDGSCTSEPSLKKKVIIKDVNFEEVKAK